MLQTTAVAAMLAANPFFEGFGAEAVTALAALCTSRRLAAEELLFQKGDPGDALFAVRRGQIRIATGTEAGRRLTLNILGSGDVFGEIALLDGYPRTAEARALEPSELFVLRRRDFLLFLERTPAVAVKVIDLLCERLRWMSSRVEETALLPVEARLARRVVMLAQDYGSVLNVSQEELAQFVGAARESVNRHLQEWKRDGLVALGRSRITVVQPDRLSARYANVGLEQQEVPSVVRSAVLSDPQVLRSPVQPLHG
jgi:CRP/FNR family transcriptional regulator, cyclic AMP receptor protein